MMLFLTPTARLDLAAILDPIEAQDIDQAIALYTDFDRALELLGRFPDLGHPRTDLTKRDVRFWTVSTQWALVYRVTDRIEVLHIVPWAMDVAILLKDEHDRRSTKRKRKRKR